MWYYYKHTRNDGDACGKRCENCNEKYASNKKLKNHMCSVYAKNPSHTEFNMKNLLKKMNVPECLHFNEKIKNEIAIIHCALYTVICVYKTILCPAIFYDTS